MNKFFDWAKYYASLGWRILPNHVFINGKCSCYLKEKCKSAGKHPRIENWPQKATTEVQQLEDWFVRMYPNGNIGIATGPKSNIVVLDIDVKDGGIETWKELAKKYNYVPNTPEAQTGSGGYHLFYKSPKRIQVPTKARLISGVGIDVRGEGGQAVLPPSINSSGAYGWSEDPWILSDGV